MTERVSYAAICQCGRPMAEGSKHCAICSSAQPWARSQHKPCPNCGNPMDHRAKLCRACTHDARQRHVQEPAEVLSWWGTVPDYSAIPADFLDAFAGLFLAEGYVGIGGGKSETTVVSTIKLRADDAAVLHLAQSMFGGTLIAVAGRTTPQGYQCAPQVHWYLQGMGRNLLFLKLMEKHGAVLPAKKHNDIRLVIEYIEWRIARPRRLTDENRAAMAQYHERLIRGRQYTKPDL
jgi:predicted RNA-binding Zn-ribbon protein involved in translation (DUF1610 family)